MKKIVALLLVLVLSLAFVACDDKKPAQTTGTAAPTTETPTTETPTTEKKQPTAPTAYKMYEGDGFGFAYPKEWSKESSGAIDQLINSTGAGNNITVSYEAYSDIYTTMTAARFNTQIKPSLEQAGMQVKNVSVEQGTSEFDVPLTKIVYTATIQSVEMKQTLVVFAKGDRNYCITVTEVAPHAALVENVLATLHLVED